MHRPIKSHGRPDWRGSVAADCSLSNGPPGAIRMTKKVQSDDDEGASGWHPAGGESSNSTSPPGYPAQDGIGQAWHHPSQSGALRCGTMISRRDGMIYTRLSAGAAEKDDIPRHEGLLDWSARARALHRLRRAHRRLHRLPSQICRPNTRIGSGCPHHLENPCCRRDLLVT